MLRPIAGNFKVARRVAVNARPVPEMDDTPIIIIPNLW